MPSSSVNWYWILTLLVALSPITINLDVPGTDEKLLVTISLELKP